jgi:hypothetical protein
VRPHGLAPSSTAGAALLRSTGLHAPPYRTSARCRSQDPALYECSEHRACRALPTRSLSSSKVESILAHHTHKRMRAPPMLPAHILPAKVTTVQASSSRSVSMGRVVTKQAACDRRLMQVRPANARQSVCRDGAHVFYKRGLRGALCDVAHAVPREARETGASAAAHASFRPYSWMPCSLP